MKGQYNQDDKAAKIIEREAGVGAFFGLDCAVNGGVATRRFDKVVFFDHFTDIGNLGPELGSITNEITQAREAPPAAARGPTRPIAIIRPARLFPEHRSILRSRVPDQPRKLPSSENDTLGTLRGSDVFRPYQVIGKQDRRSRKIPWRGG